MIIAGLDYIECPIITCAWCRKELLSNVTPTVHLTECVHMQCCRPGSELVFPCLFVQGGGQSSVVICTPNIRELLLIITFLFFCACLKVVKEQMVVEAI